MTVIPLVLDLGLQVSYAFFLGKLAHVLRDSIVRLNVAVRQRIVATSIVDLDQHATLLLCLLVQVLLSEGGCSFRSIEVLRVAQVIELGATAGGDLLKVKISRALRVWQLLLRVVVELISWLLQAIQTLLQKHVLLPDRRLLWPASVALRRFGFRKVLF